MQALGAKDDDFFYGLMRQMLTYTSGEVDDDLALKMMISFIEDVKPKDQVHAALGLQMAAMHQNVMKFIELLSKSTTLAEFTIYGRIVTALGRAYTDQMAAHKHYSSTNEPSVRVQNVSVQDGGRASQLAPRHYRRQACADASRQRAAAPACSSRAAQKA
jgi:hypothetical protein